MASTCGPSGYSGAARGAAWLRPASSPSTCSGRRLVGTCLLLAHPGALPHRGASGAIFGLFARTLLVRVRLAPYVQILLWLSLIAIKSRDRPAFISWQGHLGGLVGGVVDRSRPRSPRARRSLWQGVGLSLVALAFLAAVAARTLVLTEPVAHLPGKSLLLDRDPVPSAGVRLSLGRNAGPGADLPGQVSATSGTGIGVRRGAPAVRGPCPPGDKACG